MEPRLSIDTTFLIDLQRERRDGHDGDAHRYLRANADAELYLSVVALGEFAEGFGDGGHPILTGVKETHTLVTVDEGTADIYADVARRLRDTGNLIGANDLWIGCSSLRHDLPVVTANTEHFRRIPGLRVIGYREPD